MVCAKISMDGSLMAGPSIRHTKPRKSIAIAYSMLLVYFVASVYIPGTCACTEFVVRLIMICARAESVYRVHIRSQKSLRRVLKRVVLYRLFHVEPSTSRRWSTVEQLRRNQYLTVRYGTAHLLHIYSCTPTNNRDNLLQRYSLTGAAHRDSLFSKDMNVLCE